MFGTRRARGVCSMHSCNLTTDQIPDAKSAGRSDHKRTLGHHMQNWPSSYFFLCILAETSGRPPGSGQVFWQPVVKKKPHTRNGRVASARRCRRLARRPNESKRSAMSVENVLVVGKKKTSSNLYQIQPSKTNVNEEPKQHLRYSFVQRE